MRGSKKITISLFLQLIFLVSISQDSSLNFILLNGPEGKPFGHVRNIIQDKYGYLWFSAQSGKCIYRYDGNRFTIFRQDPNNSNSLGGTQINSVYADDNGLIWIGMGNGLDQYNPATGVFKHYRHDSDPASISEGVTETPVLKDRKGRLWVGTVNGLDQLDINTGKFVHYRTQKGNPKSLSSNFIWSIYEDQQGVIWVATGNPWFNKDPEDGGLNRFNDNGTFTRYMHDPNDPHSLINNKVGAIYEDSAGVFWVGTGGDGLHTMDRKTGRFTRHLYNPLQPNQLSRPPLNPNDQVNDKINFITCDITGAMWIGTELSGMNRYDPETKKITHFNNSNGFPYFGAWSAFTSKDGVLWIATEQNAVVEVNPFRKSLKRVELGAPTPEFLEDKNKDLWVGTFGNGLFRLDKNKKVQAHYTQNSNNPFSLPDNNIIGLFENNDGRIWTGSIQGLRIMDKTAGHFYSFNNIEILKDSNNSGITHIVKDKQGMIWMSRWSMGIFSFNPKDSSFKQYQYSSDDSTSLGSNLIFSAIVDSSGVIWIGGVNGGGISRFNREADNFKHYLRGIDIQIIFQDSKNNLWAGSDQGLYKYSQKDDRFSLFLEPQSEINTFPIVDIAEDDENQLWLITRSQIIKLNLSTRETFIYGKRFGISNLDFGKIYKTSTGEMLVGFEKGFYYFLPKELAVKTGFNLVISGLLVNSHSVYPGDKIIGQRAIEEINKLDFSYKENNLVLRFTAIDYREPESVKYYYMLEGYDGEWHKLQEKQDKSASYFNLSPGSYLFKVKAFNDEGTMSERSITIKIHPPWWKTWWAYSLYALFGILLIVFLYRQQKQNIIRKEREKRQQFELAQAKEIEKAYHELRSMQAQLIQSEKMASLGELTAGIAHEIQNPLNFVNNFADVNTELIDEAERALDLDDKQESKKLMAAIRENEEKIKHHGSRADAIVKSMLQHSRTSTGQKEPTDINALADEYLRLAYHGLRAKDKTFNAIMKTELDPAIGKINIISQDMGRVLLNLYNNAFYAVAEKSRQNIQDYQPTVKLITKLVTDSEITVGSQSAIRNSQSVIISVQDNGPGIPSKVVDKIFQPFFTTKPTGQGTGLGLSLSYDIIKNHNGDIRVKTEVGKFTIIDLYLPVSIRT